MALDYEASIGYPPDHGVCGSHWRCSRCGELWPRRVPSLYLPSRDGEGPHCPPCAESPEFAHQRGRSSGWIGSGDLDYLVIATTVYRRVHPYRLYARMDDPPRVARP